MATSLTVTVVTAVAAVVTALLPGAAARADTGVCVDPPRAPFVDVGDGGTHTAAIDCLRAVGVLGGTRVDAFAPDTTVRRDRMASLVVRALDHAGIDLPAPDRPPFDDVDPASTHGEAIGRLAEAGVVRGTGERTYTPDAAVPRGQMTAFLVGAHELLVGRDDEPDTEPGDHPFDDARGHVHEASIARAAALDLAQGQTSDRFAPDEVTTRAHIATFLERLLGAGVEAGALATADADRQVVAQALPASVRRDVTGSSWRADCPVGLDDLRLLETVHTDLAGTERVGLLIVHADAVTALTGVLETIRDERFPVHRMQLVDRYGADDDRSMAANNTHAFNCRFVGGTSTYSQHSYGRAIDINPVQNPYVSGSGAVSPSAGRAYTDRRDVRPGMVVEGGPVVAAFDAAGWGWGGRWTSSKDWQHFSANGR